MTQKISKSRLLHSMLIAFVILPIWFSDCSKKSTEPTGEDDKIKVIITVFKNTESGEQFAQNTLVTATYLMDSTSVATDKDGLAIFWVPDTTAFINIVINEPDCFAVDTVLTNLENPVFTLHLFQIVYYVPTEPGSKFQYDVYYSYQRAERIDQYSGIESWDVAAYSDSLKGGTIKCTFEGSKYYLEWGESKFDTVSVEHVTCSREYGFQLRNGLFLGSSYNTNECETVFDFFLKWFIKNDCFIVGFKPGSSTSMNLDFVKDHELYLEYLIEKDVGLMQLEASRPTIFGGPCLKYKLLQN